MNDLAEMKKSLREKYKNNKQQLNYKLQRSTKDFHLHWVFSDKFKVNAQAEVESYLYEAAFYERTFGIILPVRPFPFFDFQVNDLDFNKNMVCKMQFV